VYPDGSGWVFLIQKAPVAAYELVGAADPWWPMIDGLARALDQTPDASARAHVAWTREGLLQACVEQGAPWNTVADWPASRLLWGLLAESCSVTMRDIAQAWPDRCVFPDEEHDCVEDMFTEVFSRWSAGLIDVPSASRFRIGSIRVRSAYNKAWVEAASRRKLERAAIRDGWDKASVRRVRTRRLRSILSTPHRPGAKHADCDMVTVPDPHADWGDIAGFAETFTDQAHAVPEPDATWAGVRDKWLDTHYLPRDLDTRRASLLHETRRHEAAGVEPTGGDRAYIAALVDSMGARNQYEVPGRIIARHTRSRAE
jgi:hypothetical protein